MTTWHAVFKDNTTLNQYDDQGREVQFRKVLDRIKDLKSLSIRLPNKQIYTISLVDGMFNIENKCVYVLDTNIYPPKKLKNIRPIYFERWQQDFSANGRPLKHMHLFTAIGFQALFEGRNVKRYLEVYDSGDYKVREK